MRCRQFHDDPDASAPATRTAEPGTSTKRVCIPVSDEDLAESTKRGHKGGGPSELMRRFAVDLSPVRKDDDLDLTRPDRQIRRLRRIRTRRLTVTGAES
jgi:hypothetical protein